MHTETVNRVYLYIKNHAIFKENETKTTVGMCWITKINSNYMRKYSHKGHI